MKILVLATLLSTSCAAQWISGYYDREGNMPISEIAWSKYTNVIHACVQASSGGTLLVGTGGVVQSDIAPLIAAGHAAGKKVSVCIGDSNGHSFADDTGSTYLSTFVSNIASFVRTNGYDGVDLDWEQGVNSTQQQNLLSALRAALPRPYLLTSAALNSNGNQETTFANQQANVDQINIMCYDSDDLGYTWYHAAIYASALAANGTDGGCQYRMQAFVNAGVAPSKLGMGLPFYGRHWTGTDALYQTSGTKVGPVFYQTLVTTLSSSVYALRAYDSVKGADYASLPSTNEFYDWNGLQSIDQKVAYVKSKGYGGYMIWLIGYEYLSGQTGDAKHPLSTELYAKVFGASGSAPTISSFTASPSTISGSSSTLSWSTSGATSLSIDQGIGTVTGTTSKVVSPTATTTYTLTATNSAGSVTKSVTVTVNVSNPPPTISSFAANPTITGPGESSMLSWATTGAISLSINPDLGIVTNSTSRAVSPTRTTTYTLTASNAAGSVTMPTTVTVSSGPLAYWKLDAGSGTTAADSSGNGHTMALFNAPGWLAASSCAVNGCLTFNGTNQYGSSALDLSGTNVITVAFWLKWTAYANDNRIALEFTPNFNNTTTGFLILPDENVSGQFQAGVLGNAGYNQVNFPRPSAGVWHHYAVVMNKGASAATQVIPYVDGQAVSYTKPTTAANTNNFGKDTLFAMSRSGASLFGSGRLDELQIFPRALSAAEILSLVTASSPNITTTSSLSAGTVGLPYSQTLTSSGSTPMTWAVTSGALPAGLSLNSSSGVITGTPNTAGSFSFIVGATNAAGSDSQQFSVTVNPSSSALNYNVSDLKWASATIGWGTIHLNASVLANVLILNGASYTEGIGTHANSQIVYNINGACNTLQSSVGLDDEVGSLGSVVFQVFGDAVKLYDSTSMTGSSATQKLSISVAGFQQLKLVVNDGGDGINSDHADWANPRLTCSTIPPAAN